MCEVHLGLAQGGGVGRDVSSSGKSVDWPVYAGSAAGDRYSGLAQIDRSNVDRLEVVWRHQTGDGNLETSPLMIGTTLYAITPAQNVIALDATTGALRWTFDSSSTNEQAPRSEGAWEYLSKQAVRGLNYWTDGKEQRLFAGAGTYLYALDPRSGRPVTSFGQGGRVDLREGLGRDYQSLATFLTSPGIVYSNLIIVGFRTSEAKPAAPGAVRAYDVRTGKLRWIFGLIPKPGEAGHETWPRDAWRSAGGANVWAGFALDEKRGILYAPTGSAVDDFYGADRAGDNLYANSLVALNAATGGHLWHFQAIHHDLWDWDLSSPPALLTIQRDGRKTDAVAQTSKHGFVFVFDRVTGVPLFPIEERAVPQSDVPGEQTSPTQPFPLKPAPFARQRLTRDLVTTRTPRAHDAALKELETFHNEGLFTPLVLGRQTVVFPGFEGGAQWGGPAIDRERGVIYINSTDSASLGGLSAPLAQTTASPARDLYERQCAICHGLNLEGAPHQFPRLIDVATRLSRGEITEVIRRGRGRMPGFPQFGRRDIDAIVAFLSGSSIEPVSDSDHATQASRGVVGKRPGYLFTGYKKWLDSDGYPAVKPPWGTLSAIDLNTGEYIWRVPLGEYPELSAQGIPATGTENYGGPIVTRGGVVFIGATVYDRKFRAFDSRDGRILWQSDLAFAGVATPITYMIRGRQYVVIASSGGRDPKGPQGSEYVAFALPESAVQYKNSKVRKSQHYAGEVEQ